MSQIPSKVTFATLLVTLGIVFGDIGTSPLYVMSAILGKNPITKELVYGGLSCIFWTLTIQATFKYILLTLRADNHGEGGIFSLYALIKRQAPRWTVYAAMIGCSALLADGIITPFCHYAQMVCDARCRHSRTGVHCSQSGAHQRVIFPHQRSRKA